MDVMKGAERVERVISPLLKTVSHHVTNLMFNFNTEEGGIVESLSATLWAFLLTVTKVSRYVPYDLLVK